MSPNEFSQDGRDNGSIPQSRLASMGQRGAKDDFNGAYAGNVFSTGYADEDNRSRFKERGDGQNPDEGLLRVGLPPLPSIDTWLIEPENEPVKDEGSFGQLLKVGDPDSAMGSAPNRSAAEQSASAQRTIPRLVFRPTQAVIVILVLVVALCASLTMLVTQAVNYNRQQTEASSVSSEVSSGPQSKSSKREQGNTSRAGGGSGPSQSLAGTDGQNAEAGSDSSSANPPTQTETATGQGNLINLNTADSTQLQQIKGVGPVMAQKIIDYRSSIGRFNSVDQLLKVSGIGQKTLEKIRGQVTV
ncbi:helix-hairpin-helix domain-containing protein [Bifidobacterium sp. ESL0682]|uniref:ComEA family DNA-binding protein n=1 Tax=Bifidobacterium sp. ESL0682 TaxID=2983212 RepID=UPI0023F83534|nr:helix-hairpin-helix domain-containing protein [Bifidobacterium sp. ESL0682]WEV41370.1 helix-hairpin-helix domain-containing protein [Bifidobacterium sp. ESL0682]